MQVATDRVIANAKNNPDEIGAASHAYMELRGLTLFCFMWQRMLAAAYVARAVDKGNKEYLEGLIKCGVFFMQRLIPKSKSLVAEINAGAQSLMALTASEF